MKNYEKFSKQIKKGNKIFYQFVVKQNSILIENKNLKILQYLRKHYRYYHEKRAINYFKTIISYGKLVIEIYF